MIDIQLVTQTGLMLLVVLLIGYLSEKIGFINKDFTQTLSRFTMCVAQPCLLFCSVAGAAYSKSLIKQGGLVLLLAFGAHAVMAIMAKGAALVYPDREERKISEFGLLFVNCAFVGYPLLDAAFGEIGLFRGAFWVTAFNLIIWTWGIFLLSRGRTDIPFSLRRVILNYGTVPCLLGLLVYLLRIPIPSVVLDGMEAVGGLCTPVALLIIGANLARIPLRKLFGGWKIYYFSVMRLLVFPLMVALLCRLCGLSDTWCLFVCIMTALPTAANTVMFAEMYDIRPDAAAKTVGMTAVLSMLTISPITAFASDLLSHVPR